MARNAVIDEERRDLALAVARPLVRADDDGSERFDGHASVVNTRTAIGNPLRWGFYEEVAPGAFTKTLSEGDSRMLIDHDSYYVVSRKSAGTLRLNEDTIGLHVDSALDVELSYVRDLKVNLRNGNITGMSFGFYVVKDEWSTEEVETSDGNTAEVEIRRIQEIRLIEVSAVTFPAYPTTDAGLRSVAVALRSRGDDAAIARRLSMAPDLGRFLPPVRTSIQVPADLNLDAGDTVDTTGETSEIGVDVDSATRTSDVTKEANSDVASTVEEPGETTPPSERTDVVETEPGETTRVAPSASDLAAARLRALKANLRQPA